MAEKIETLHIHELRGDNFKRLKHFAVKLQPGVTQVTGKNGAGKSTFLDVVRHLLGNAAQHSAEVIRRGEESCQLVGDLGEFIVERRWRKTDKGELQTVVLKAKDGSRLQSPQAILDSFYSTYTFNPVRFMDLDAKRQLEEARELVGVNTGPIDGRRQDLYEQRTDVNRRGGDMKARFLALRAPEKALPEKPVDLGELLGQQKALRTVGIENERARLKLNDLSRISQRSSELRVEASARVHQLETQLEQARRDLENASRAAEENAEAFNAHATLVKNLKDPDFEAVGKQVREAELTNMAIIRETDRKRLEGELEGLRAESDSLSKAIEQLDREKAELIAKAKFPVPGLGFGADGLTLNGFPLEQASSAERMRVSVAMGFARNPKLKFMAVHDGSLLDDESLELLELLCTEYGGQLLIERVGASSETGVVIEDGEVVAGPALRSVKGQQDLGVVVEGREPGGAR